MKKNKEKSVHPQASKTVESYSIYVQRDGKLFFYIKTQPVYEIFLNGEIIDIETLVEVLSAGIESKKIWE